MTASKSSDQEIHSRLVLNFPGFEQTDSVAQLGRLRYGAEITGSHWGFNVDQGDLNHAEDTHHTQVDYKASGGNWATDVRLVQFRWNDIVHAYEKENYPAGFLKNLRKYAAFLVDGTIRKYAKASWRYWGFTIFPVLLIVIFALVSAVLAGFITAFFDIPFMLQKLLSLLIGIVVLLGLCKWPGDRLYLPLTIADWGFARDMVHRSNREIEDRFIEFGETALAEIAKSDHQEIVIVGHSFGSLWAVVALSKALEKEPDLFKGKSIRFLALGSSMLKIALAPDAQFMRDHWQRVMDQPELFWHEVQTKDDLIAFYPCDPFEEAEITEPKAEYKISQIRFGKGMKKKRYKSMRRSFYRTHRQYILYYDKRVHFDYMLRLLGPFSIKSLAGDKEVVNRIDPEGRLL